MALDAVIAVKPHTSPWITASLSSTDLQAWSQKPPRPPLSAACDVNAAYSASAVMQVQPTQQSPWEARSHSGVPLALLMAHRRLHPLTELVSTVYHGVPQCTTVYSTQWTPFDWAASYIPSSEHQYATPSHRRVIVFTCCCFSSLVSLNLFLASVTLSWSEVWYGLRYGLRYESRGMRGEVWVEMYGKVQTTRWVCARALNSDSHRLGPHLTLAQCPLTDWITHRDATLTWVQSPKSQKDVRADEFLWKL